MGLDDLINGVIAKLQQIYDDSASWLRKSNSRRNRLATDAARNNLDDGKELRLMNSGPEVHNRLIDRYNHCKWWEAKFRGWGGHDNDFARSNHAKAKDVYYEAAAETIKMMNTAVGSRANMVAVFQNIGIEGTGTVNLKVDIKSGYSSTQNKSNELHTSVSASVSAAITYMVATVTAEVSTSVASKIASSSSIVNTKETTTTIEIEADLGKPFYIYQVKFDVGLADDSSLSVWGAGYIVSPVPISNLPSAKL